MNTIITIDGITIDYSKVIGIEHENLHSDGPNQIRVIFGTRKEYIFNPETECYELHEITDEAHFPFPEYELAQGVLQEMTETWIKTKQ